MREDTFSLQSSLEANYLNIELQEPIQMDEIAVRVIKEDCPEFLIPFRMVNINDKVTLKYKLINTTALEYSNKNLHKKEFVRLYLNLLTPFIKGKDWFLDYHNFCIDSRYIFIDKQKTNVHFIYVPENSYRNTDEEILQFFKGTFTDITISDDANFQVKLYRYFSRKEITLSDLYQMFLQELQNTEEIGKIQPSPAAAHKQMAAPVTASVVEKKVSQQNMISGTEKKPVQEKPESSSAGVFGVLGNNSDSDAVMDALFGDGKKKKEKEKAPAKKKEGGFNLFGKKKQKEAVPELVSHTGEIPAPAANSVPQMNSVPASGGFVLADGGGDDRTEISDDGGSAGGAYMELFESPIPGAIPRINLDFTKPYIIIGRMSSDEVQPDVAFGREFSRIGRRHARIEKKDGEYYVIDLGSANHTLLNGQTLIPNQPYHLMDGGELTFTISKPVRYRVHL
jgi:hypothetical protein